MPLELTGHSAGETSDAKPLLFCTSQASHLESCRPKKIAVMSQLNAHLASRQPKSAIRYFYDLFPFLLGRSSRQVPSR